MCRWLAYLGEPIQPSKLIVDTPNSLVAQSLNSPLGAQTVNGDGFGLAWYPDATAESTPAVFRSIEPAWHDENVRELSRAIETPLFFAHVRAATLPPVQKTNCHPFRYESWLFMHNGVIREFPRLHRQLALAIAPELFESVRGTTDSEVLFFLALTHGLREDPVGGLARAIREVEQVGRAHGIPYPVQGTFAISNGSTVWAFRYSSERRSRTLFHSEDVTTLRMLYPEVERLQGYGEQSRVIVSEPLSDLPDAFHEVPESTVAILDMNGYRHEPFLQEA
ncbi:class II glutamine amidotransferase [Ruicaihuangia caeni]|uniref:Class II glutamine amidotransferase n=1 Tax=Ruicaihuangia caeni TaxID=3042517 RepID=A0AAW6T6K6_9MICO|nr:class II glutamine amidotransferase [Klugiella sp. YN-L-19]MDI2097458.1 class II glutamine amidotransferase [Klugiella sp. YN-L-19]